MMLINTPTGATLNTRDDARSAIAYVKTHLIRSLNMDVAYVNGAIAYGYHDGDCQQYAPGYPDNLRMGRCAGHHIATLVVR